MSHLFTQQIKMNEDQNKHITHKSLMAPHKRNNYLSQSSLHRSQSSFYSNRSRQGSANSRESCRNSMRAKEGGGNVTFCKQQSESRRGSGHLESNKMGLFKQASSTSHNEEPVVTQSTAPKHNRSTGQPQVKSTMQDSKIEEETASPVHNKRQQQHHLLSPGKQETQLRIKREESPDNKREAVFSTLLGRLQPISSRSPSFELSKRKLQQQQQNIEPVATFRKQRSQQSPSFKSNYNRQESGVSQQEADDHQERRKDYLFGDEESDDTDYSKYSVSSVDDNHVNVLAPSTKILKFPMKQDQSQILEIRVVDPQFIQKEPQSDCCCCLPPDCFQSVKNCFTCNKKKQCSNDISGGSSSLTMQTLMNAESIVRLEGDQESFDLQSQQQKTARGHWKILQRRLIMQIRMRRMAEYFMKIPSLPEQLIEPTFVETNCPRLQRLLISPMNKKLYYYNQFFGIIVLLDIIYAIIIAFDFNRTYYNFNIQDIYMFVFILDFFLNFLKVPSLDVRDHDILRVFLHYLKTQMLFDLLAITPYQLMDHDRDTKGPLGATLRFLRLARLSRFVQSARGLIFSFETFCSNYARWIKKNVVQNISSVIWLILILAYMCHFLTSAWVYIGQDLENREHTGWIVHMKRDGIVEDIQLKYSTLYIAGMYNILTTLSTVGYGDVVGTENIEYVFQMIVMIIGIGYFAYFMGKMNSLFQSSGFSEFQDEGLDQWLIRLDKAKKNKVLEYEIFQGVQKFFTYFASREIQTIKDNDFYWQLKPRLQKTLFDQLFADHYTLFEMAFKGTESEFRRKVITNMRFKMLHRTQPRNQLLNTISISRYKPIVFEKGEMPKNVYFIIKGEVFFTNESGTFHYFKLSSGSYFGDVNILLNHKSAYSAHFDENAEPVLLLAIKRDKFLSICNKFPDSKRVMFEMAKKRRKQFKIHKLKSLVKLMMVIIKNYNIGFKNMAHVDLDYFERQHSVIEMYKLLVSHFKFIGIRRDLRKCAKIKEQRILESNKKAKDAKYMFTPKDDSSHTMSHQVIIDDDIDVKSFSQEEEKELRCKHPNLRVEQVEIYKGSPPINTEEKVTKKREVTNEDPKNQGKEDIDNFHQKAEGNQNSRRHMSSGRMVSETINEEDQTVVIDMLNNQEQPQPPCLPATTFKQQELFSGAVAAAKPASPLSTVSGAQSFPQFLNTENQIQTTAPPLHSTTNDYDSSRVSQIRKLKLFTKDELQGLRHSQQNSDRSSLRNNPSETREEVKQQSALIHGGKTRSTKYVESQLPFSFSESQALKRDLPQAKDECVSTDQIQIEEIKEVESNEESYQSPDKKRGFSQKKKKIITSNNTTPRDVGSQSREAKRFSLKVLREDNKSSSLLSDSPLKRREAKKIVVDQDSSQSDQLQQQQPPTPPPLPDIMNGSPFKSTKLNLMAGLTNKKRNKRDDFVHLLHSGELTQIKNLKLHNVEKEIEVVRDHIELILQQKQSGHGSGNRSTPAAQGELKDSKNEIIIEYFYDSDQDRLTPFKNQDSPSALDLKMAASLGRLKVEMQHLNKEHEIQQLLEKRQQHQAQEITASFRNANFGSFQ